MKILANLQNGIGDETVRVSLVSCIAEKLLSTSGHEKLNIV